MHVGAWFNESNVQFEGETNVYTRTDGDQGSAVDFHFCPKCGTSIWWPIPSRPEVVGIAVGCFADPSFPIPSFSIYNKRRHDWVSNPQGDPAFAVLPPSNSGDA